MRFRSLFAPAAAALVALSVVAFAQGVGTVFVTSKGDLTFPFTAPTKSAPGAMRNMNITFVQAAPAAKTVSATLTAAEVLTGIITVNQGAAGASALQLPLATAMDTALTNEVVGDAVDFSVINVSTVAAEDASITTNTGWTLVGNMDVASNAAATDKSAGRFRARKTGTGTWVLYRLS